MNTGDKSFHPDQSHASRKIEDPETKGGACVEFIPDKKVVMGSIFIYTIHFLCFCHLLNRQGLAFVLSIQS